MRISDWSSDVCSSDLRPKPFVEADGPLRAVLFEIGRDLAELYGHVPSPFGRIVLPPPGQAKQGLLWPRSERLAFPKRKPRRQRSEEHTSELQSLMRNSYAVFCLKKKINYPTTIRHNKNL